MTAIHRLALKLAFGAAVFGIIAWLVDLTETFQVLRGVNSTWLLLAVLCYISKRVLMAIKWWILLGGRTASISYATVQRKMLLSDYHGLLFPNTLALGALHAVFFVTIRAV